MGVIGRTVPISFPSSLSLMEYITPIPFSLSPLKSESTETVHGTVWPSQCDAKHKVLAKKKTFTSLPLPSVSEA